MKRALASAAAAALVCVAATMSVATSSASADGGGAARTTSTPRLTGPQRDVIRDVTKRFRDPDAAVAAGYVATDVCTELPGTGGMGYHYAHIPRASDLNIDPTLPEVLVYVPGRNGRLKLGAVEYLKADIDQNLETADDRPTLFGHPFDGPMLGHEPGMPIHYDLHVWLYEQNPAGELSAWNPRVTCPM